MTNQTNFTTILTEIEYTYQITGKYPITINATNLVSKSIIEFEIEVIDKLIGMHFHAGEYENSSSLLGSDAYFWFYLKNGMGYSCLVDYGDGGTDKFNDEVRHLLFS